jgi:predicted membrane protein
MWAIKVLNGPQAGKIFQMKKGTYSIGRSPQATIRVKSASISKVHAKFMVVEDKIIISDNQSSNGIVVNGIKVQNKVLRSGDKFSLGEILFDIIELPEFVSILPDQVPGGSSLVTHGTQALAQQFEEGQEQQDLQILSSSVESAPEEVSRANLTVQEKVEAYIENVALPGVYEYSYKFDLKYVVLSFVIFFVVLVTALSVIPVLRVSRAFVVDESVRRAEALAKLLVQENREYVVSNNEVSVNIRSVAREPGVDQAYIIDALDGRIIAPVKQRGRYSKIPFLARARKKPNRYRDVMDKQIGVSHPILHMNPETGEPTPKAYAIVLYNLDRVALDVPRTLSLMIQILLITLLAGAVLYFFLYKVITKPVYDLNDELNIALKEGTNNIEIRNPTPIFQRLVANVNSALSRMSSEDHSISVGMGDKSMEAAELVEMFPVAAVAVSGESEMILAHNELIHGHPLFEDDQIKEKYLDDLTDRSLVQCIKDLLQKSADNPNQKHNNTLPASSGINFDVSIKSIQEVGTISYYVLCFTEVYDEEGFDE